MNGLVLTHFSIRRSSKLLLSFALFSILLGVRGFFETMAILTRISLFGIIGYFSGIISVLIFFIFIELIFQRFVPIEIALAFLFGVLFMQSFDENVVIGIFVQFSDTLNLISGIMFIIVGIFVMYLSYEIYKASKIYKLNKKYSNLFIVSLLFGFSSEISLQLASVLFETLQLYIPIVVAIADSLLLIAVIKEPLLIYVVSIKVQSIHIYHITGVELFSKTLLSEKSIDKLSEIFYLISQSLGKAQIDIRYVIFEGYILQFIKCSELIVFFLSRKYNRVLYALIERAICDLDAQIKDKNIISDEVYQLIQSRIAKDFPLNLLSQI